MVSPSRWSFGSATRAWHRCGWVDVESAYDSPWTAQVNGRRGDVYFSREEREAVVEPGTTRTFKPRLYGVAGVGPIVLRCGEGGPFVQCP